MLTLISTLQCSTSIFQLAQTFFFLAFCILHVIGANETSPNTNYPQSHQAIQTTMNSPLLVRGALETPPREYGDASSQIVEHLN